MIIQRLIPQYLRPDDTDFYLLQTWDAIRWLRESGVAIRPGMRALDLGCGHGFFGAELAKAGCQVCFADEADYRRPGVSGCFHPVNLDRDPLACLGESDLVICSNVLEHLAEPEGFLDSMHHILSRNGRMYLSWTNWLSPWGGHEFSPFHYLGVRRGHLIYDRLIGRKRRHTPFQNLFPTYIGEVMQRIERSDNLTVLRAAPRYYTELEFLAKLPLARELLMWNCALLIGRKV